MRQNTGNGHVSMYEINLLVSIDGEGYKRRYLDLFRDFLEHENIDIELNPRCDNFSSKYSSRIEVSGSNKDKILDFLHNKKEFVYGCKPILV